jgi:hypothetical protein
VIDSSDVSRLATSRSELLTMLAEDELKSVPVLVFANKQDVEGALSPAEISDKLGLAGGEKGREWSVRGSCATKGEGLEEGLDWCVFSFLFVLIPCVVVTCPWCRVPSRFSLRAAVPVVMRSFWRLEHPVDSPADATGWSIQYKNRSIASCIICRSGLQVSAGVVCEFPLFGFDSQDSTSLLAMMVRKSHAKLLRSLGLTHLGVEYRHVSYVLIYLV